MEPLVIAGTGSALPDRVVSNAELESLSGFAASRIVELFEIDERRWSRSDPGPDPAPGQRCSDLAVAAGRAAMGAAGVSAQDVGALLVASTTPDSLNPPLDRAVAHGLGLRGVPAFSLHAPCTGAFRALRLAEALSPSLGGKAVVIVAADTPSPFFRFGPDVLPEHVMNSVLYADAAGALVAAVGSGVRGPRLEALRLDLNEDDATPGITFPGLMSAAPPTAARLETGEYLGHHEFRRVLRRGSEMAAKAALDLLAERGLATTDIRCFLTHQATGNIRRIAASWGLPAERIPVNIARVGNTISASILLLLDEVARSGQMAAGDLAVLHTAESSTWSRASALLRW